MDFDYLNYPYLSSFLIQRYVQKSKDAGVYSVLNFYKCYRAFVRGKVHGFQINDPHIETEKKQILQDAAKKYFQLSEYYAHLFALETQLQKPLLFLVLGLSGTGKSTVAQKIAVDYHAVVINTDVVRKEIAGIDTYEQHHDQFNTGLYDPKKIDDTYAQVMQHASTCITKGQNVVLDATFQKKKYREMAQHIARKHHATMVIVQCICPDGVVKKRLEDRLKKKSVSDGRWEIYLVQKTTFEPLSSDEQSLMIDTSEESYEYRMTFYQRLLRFVRQTGEVV
jgi:predicted kinase